MLNKDQTQDVGDGATAIQAGGNVTVNNMGLNYSQARDVALDVFRANFYELAGMAKETARARAEEVTEEFLKKLEKENPAGLSKSEDPDFQYALFTVQREYARNGDKDLGNLLVDLLVDRSKHDQRDILQIVLNESLLVAPKLTSAQINTLSLIQLLSNMRFDGLTDYNELESVFSKALNLTSDLTDLSESGLLHLQYSGAMSINHIIKKDISRKVHETYKYLSNNSGYDDFVKTIKERASSLIKCIEIFNDHGMYRAELTSVGTLIGLANLKKVFKDIDYSVWIN